MISNNFDLQIQELHKNVGLDALKDHPAVKRVTAQRMVIRHLHFVNETEDEEESDIWGEHMFTNVSNTEAEHVIFNVSDSDKITLAAESSLNSMEESLHSQEYDNVFPETSADKTKPESKIDDEPCDGKECNEDETENGTWPASRPLRRSSLTLVSCPTNHHSYSLSLSIPVVTPALCPGIMGCYPPQVLGAENLRWAMRPSTAITYAPNFCLYLLAKNCKQKLRGIHFICAWPLHSFQALWPISLWWVTAHVRWMQGRCDNLVPMVCLLQVSLGTHSSNKPE